MSNTLTRFAGMSDAEIAAALKTELGSKSAVMRYLAASGWSRGKIAKAMGVRYQFVRNVLAREAKKPEVKEMTPEDLGIE